MSFPALDKIVLVWEKADFPFELEQQLINLPRYEHIMRVVLFSCAVNELYDRFEFMMPRAGLFNGSSSLAYLHGEQRLLVCGDDEYNNDGQADDATLSWQMQLRDVVDACGVWRYADTPGYLQEELDCEDATWAAFIPTQLSFEHNGEQASIRAMSADDIPRLHRIWLTEGDAFGPEGVFIHPGSKGFFFMGVEVEWEYGALPDELLYSSSSEPSAQSLIDILRALPEMQNITDMEELEELTEDFFQDYDDGYDSHY